MEKKTNIGIAYDLEVVSIFNGNTTSTIEVLATCEEGCVNWTFGFNNINGVISEYNVNDFLNDANYTMLDRKINELTMSFLGQKLAIYSIRHDEVVTLSGDLRVLIKGVWINGEEEIKDFLRLNNI